MADITLSGDGQTATIEAGAQSGEVIKTLWDLGKQVCMRLRSVLLDTHT
jgi:hypothetical protein